MNELLNFPRLDEFKVVREYRDRAESRLFRHVPTGIVFSYVPAGHFEMGLSCAEESQARRICADPPFSISEMRPVQTVGLKAFLISTLPVLKGQFYWPEASRGKEPSAPIDTSATFPALVAYADAERFAERRGFRLPTEAEWEYSCRAGSVDLFVWGDRLPSNSELAKWLEWELGNPGRLLRNRFGLAGLFFGEWCSDKFRANHSGGETRPTDFQVIKGGGAYFWPWQDQEWVWCVPAMRMPSRDLVTQEAAFRLVVDLTAED